MLWKKSWWEMRWMFLIGVGIILLAYCATFVWNDYDAARWAARLQRAANLSEAERQALNNYQGRTWAIWFKLLFSFFWANYAVVMGSVCLVTSCPVMPSQGAAGVFTFSLPVSRGKILFSQAAVGFSAVFLGALIPSLLLPIAARFQGQWFSLRDVLIYTLTMTSGGAVLFCVAFLLTVILGNYLVAFLAMEAVVFALFLPFQSLNARPGWNIIGVMAGESYFFHGRIPWLGLAISLILSAVFMFAAVRIYERRDL